MVKKSVSKNKSRSKSSSRKRTKRRVSYKKRKLNKPTKKTRKKSTKKKTRKKSTKRNFKLRKQYGGEPQLPALNDLIIHSDVRGMDDINESTTIAYNKIAIKENPILDLTVPGGSHEQGKKPMTCVDYFNNMITNYKWEDIKIEVKEQLNVYIKQIFDITDKEGWVGTQHLNSFVDFETLVKNKEGHTSVNVREKKTDQTVKERIPNNTTVIVTGIDGYNAKIRYKS